MNFYSLIFNPLIFVKVLKEINSSKRIKSIVSNSLDKGLRLNVLCMYNLRPVSRGKNNNSRNG